MEMWYLLIAEKFLFWSFWEWEIRPFLSQKVDGNMLFTDYWKVLILNFSVIENMVFFLSQEVDGKVMANTGLSSAKKLMKTWYILGLFEVSMIFRDLRNMLFPAVYVTKWKEKKCVFLLSDSSIKLQKFKMIINLLKIFHVIIEKLFNVNSCFYLFLLLYFS